MKNLSGVIKKLSLARRTKNPHRYGGA